MPNQIRLHAGGFTTAERNCRGALSRAARQPSGAYSTSLQDNVWYIPPADGEARLYLTSLGNGPAARWPRK